VTVKKPSLSLKRRTEGLISLDGDIPRGLIECDDPDASDGEIVERERNGVLYLALLETLRRGRVKRAWEERGRN